MCVLVVFKQKTGYEMRISEWSSDVCSSDRAQGLTLFSLNYLLFYVATGYVTSGLVAVAFSTITIMNIGNGEIGRASCRERVCQYVSISVVAVSFQKKTPQAYTTTAIATS